MIPNKKKLLATNSSDSPPLNQPPTTTSRQVRFNPVTTTTTSQVLDLTSSPPPPTTRTTQLLPPAASTSSPKKKRKQQNGGTAAVSKKRTRKEDDDFINDDSDDEVVILEQQPSTSSSTYRNSNGDASASGSGSGARVIRRRESDVEIIESAPRPSRLNGGLAVPLTGVRGHASSSSSSTTGSRFTAAERAGAAEYLDNVRMGRIPAPPVDRAAERARTDELRARHNQARADALAAERRELEYELMQLGYNPRDMFAGEGFGGARGGASGFGGGSEAAVQWASTSERDNYNGVGRSNGLQGLFIDSGSKLKRKGKKYSVRNSHPRRVEVGFSRSIIGIEDEEEDLQVALLASTSASATTTSLSIKGKAKSKLPPPPAAPLPPVVELEPVCASCSTPLLLGQSGLGRLWALRCGHIVCGKCIGDARMRCEVVEAGGWVMDVDPNEVEDKKGVNGNGNGSGSGKGKGKGKGKAIVLENGDGDGVEKDWMTCPVIGCNSAGTNLLAREGSWEGAFEMFV